MQYQSNGQNQNQTCNVQINVTDLVRPAPINVNLFGQNWTALPQSQAVQQAFPSNKVINPQQYSELLRNKQFQIIQVRGLEIIAAGQIRSQLGSDVCPCLVHGKVQNGIQIQVKTPTKSISTGVSN